MRDFNFFEPYLTRGKPQKDTAVSFKLLIVVLLLLVAAWPGYNFVYGMWLDREAEALKTEVTGSEKYPLLQQAEDEKAYISQLQTQLQGIESADTYLKDGEWLNEAFLFSLLSTVPKDVQIEDVQILEEKKIQLSGTASGKPAVAELETNVRNTDRFDLLYVESIINDEGTYGFKMEFVLKDGEN